VDEMEAVAVDEMHALAVDERGKRLSFLRVAATMGWELAGVARLSDSAGRRRPDEDLARGSGSRRLPFLGRGAYCEGGAEPFQPSTHREKMSRAGALLRKAGA
jgi:hypothetical protein